MRENKTRILEKPVSRRDFHRISATFGITSTLLALSGLSRFFPGPSSEALAATAKEIRKKRYRRKARFNMTFGAAHFTREGLKILPNGSIPFVADLEDRTDGEIRIEYIGGNRLCRELACAKSCIAGEIDFFSASTQNASTAAPYLNILDFAYLWPSRASQYHFFYHPKSEALLRARRFCSNWGRLEHMSFSSSANNQRLSARSA